MNGISSTTNVNRIVTRSQADYKGWPHTRYSNRAECHKNQLKQVNKMNTEADYQGVAPF
jgi:hypothetical protein